MFGEIADLRLCALRSLHPYVVDRNFYATRVLPDAPFKSIILYQNEPLLFFQKNKNF